MVVEEEEGEGGGMVGGTTEDLARWTLQATGEIKVGCRWVGGLGFWGGGGGCCVYVSVWYSQLSLSLSLSLSLYSPTHPHRPARS